MNARSNVQNESYSRRAVFATFVAENASTMSQSDAGKDRASGFSRRAEDRSCSAMVTARNMSSAGAGFPVQISNWRAA
jgi:hypothetical protein